MGFTERKLPHWYEMGEPVFLTWRLQGSLSTNRRFGAETITSGQAFAAMDRLLDETRVGAFYLRQPEVAGVVLEAFLYSAEKLRRYELHAFVIMPNHVHLLLTPTTPLAVITKTLKGFTARRANTLLGFTGKHFWQDESYDRLVRNDLEFERIRNYIEQNPVRAGLVREASGYRWSSAWKGFCGADRQVCAGPPGPAGRR